MYLKSKVHGQIESIVLVNARSSRHEFECGQFHLDLAERWVKHVAYFKKVYLQDKMDLGLCLIPKSLPE